MSQEFRVYYASNGFPGWVYGYFRVPSALTLVLCCCHTGLMCSVGGEGGSWQGHSPPTSALTLPHCCWHSEVTETTPSAAASLGVLPAGVAAASPPAALVPGPAQQSSGTRCLLCFFVAGPSLPQPQALCLRGPEPVFSPLPWGSGRTCDGSESAKPFIWAPQCILHSFLDQSWQQGTKGIWSVLCDSVASHRSNPTSAIGQRAPGLACWRKQT